MKENIEELRRRIDEIDSIIIKQLEQRMKTVTDIAEYKHGTGKPIFDKEREDRKLEMVEKSVNNKEEAPYIVETFRHIMNESRRYQRKLFNTDADGLIKPEMEENIYLIGMPGCGKSTIGRLLSDEIGSPFYDMDNIIEWEQRQSPAAIITERGEECFREIETDLLRRLSEKKGTVISTGGGIVTRANNYLHMKNNSIIIYLTREIDRLATDERPISQRKSAKLLYSERKEAYQEWSDYIVANDDVDEAVEIIKGIIIDYKNNKEN